MKKIFIFFMFTGLMFHSYGGTTEPIDERSFFYNEIHNRTTSDYSRYIISLIETILKKEETKNINITFQNPQTHLYNTKKFIHIDFNYEHTLVKEGGRSVSVDCPFGNTPTNDNKYYHVRIHRYHQLKKSDIVIDYSVPNIENITTSCFDDIFSKKLVYIAPMIYDFFYFDKSNRSNETLTTFISTKQPRRKLLLEKIKQTTLKHKNVNDCFDKNALKELYSKTKILINIHQTEHHHTFEELRVLPALLCGVLVISEESPLSHLIPYNEYIIWSPYDKIIEKSIEVLNNYDYYHDLIFGKDNHNFFSELHKSNLYNLKNKILEIQKEKL